MTLTFDSIELNFGPKRILSGVYMKCETGKITGLLGINGAGKSCLMKVVFGAMVPEHRSIRVDDRPLSRGYMRRRMIAYLPQDRLIPHWLTVREALKLYGVHRDELCERFPDLCDWLCLKPSALPGGWRRIIETMMVLRSPGEFCLLDEPFSGVMPVHIAQLKKVILEAKKSKGIILTDHLYRHVLDVSDDFVVLSGGHTYAVRDRADLIRRGYLTPDMTLIPDGNTNKFALTNQNFKARDNTKFRPGPEMPELYGRYR